MTQTTQNREKITLGGFETWVEYNQRLCGITLFGFETAKYGLHFDVMGSDGHKYINNFIYNQCNFGHNEHLKLTEQEAKELNSYINKNHLNNGQ
jgi:hypothetical protein